MLLQFGKSCLKRTRPSFKPISRLYLQGSTSAVRPTKFCMLINEFGKNQNHIEKGSKLMDSSRDYIHRSPKAWKFSFFPFFFGLYLSEAFSLIQIVPLKGWLLSEEESIGVNSKSKKIMKSLMKELSGTRESSAAAFRLQNMSNLMIFFSDLRP